MSNFVVSNRYLRVGTLLIASLCMPGLVTAQLTTDSIRLPMTLVADQRTELFARVEGYVDTVHVDIGDRVTAGQVLVTIAAPELEAELARRQQLLHQAEASLSVAQSGIETAMAKQRQVEASRQEQKALRELRVRERDRYAELVSSGAVERMMLDEAAYSLLSVEAAMAKIDADVESAVVNIDAARAHVALADAGVKVASAQLQFAAAQEKLRRIEAPFAGLITGRLVDSGQLVGAGSSHSKPLLVVEHVRVLRGVVTVPAEDARLVNVGDRVTLIRFGNATLKAPDGAAPRVSRISQSLDPQTRTMRVEIDLDNPLDEATGRYLLLSGQYGAAEIVANKTAGKR